MVKHVVIVGGGFGGVYATKYLLRKLNNRHDVKVTLLNKETKRPVAMYKPYFISNHYVLVAKPGTYILRVEGYGFQPIEQEITVEGGDSPTDIVKDFTVTVSK